MTLQKLHQDITWTGGCECINESGDRKDMLCNLKFFENKYGIKVCKKHSKTITPIKVWKQHYLNNTLDDGNCFYSSVFRALYRKKMLKTFLKEYSILCRSERQFIMKLRQIVGETCREVLVNLFEDAETKKYYIEAYKDLKKTCFSNLSKDSLYEVIDKIKKDGTYVSGIEYEIVKDMLGKIDIKLISISEDVKESYDVCLMNTIFLYNPDNIHYQYFFKTL